MKIFIVFAFLLLVASAKQGCIQLKTYSGETFYAVKNSGNENWSTSELVFTLQNVCDERYTFKNFKVLLQDWKINGKPVTSAYTSQVGNPYLNNVLTFGDNEVTILLNSMDCAQYCDWASLKGNSELSFIVTVGVLSGIETSQLTGIIASETPDDNNDKNNNKDNNNNKTDSNNGKTPNNSDHSNSTKPNNTKNDDDSNKNNNGGTTGGCTPVPNAKSPISVCGIALNDTRPYTKVSPYADITVGAIWSDWQNYPAGTPFDFSSLGKTTGVSGFTLAFIQEGGKCAPAWAGTAAMSADSTVHWGKELADRLRAQDMPFAVSFGGAAGTDLAYGCATDIDLADAYVRVYKVYQPTGFDWDIEGALQSDTAAITKILSAIKIFQGVYPNVKVSLTLPVMPDGLTIICQTLVNSASAKGINFNVNIMAMDYGQGYDANQAQNAIDAAYNTFAFLKSVYPSLSDQQIWAKVEVTPMIGVNDVISEVFTLAHADTLREFSRNYGLGGLHFWSAGRDHPCASASATATCSSGSVNQRLGI